MRLKTRRLVIRPLERADLPALARITGDPEVMRHIGDGSPMTRAQTAEYIERSMASQIDRGYSRFAVCLQGGGHLIGLCGFMEFDGEIDFGWRYERRRWGRGYATEAARAVLAFGQDDLGLTPIVCQCYVENHRSLRVIEKLGLPFDRTGSLFGRGIRRYVAREK